MKMMMLEDLLCGWRAEVEPGQICGGVPVDDVDIMVDDGQSARLPAQRVVLGEARMVWVPSRDLREGSYECAAVVTDKRSFSGANRHRSSTLRTLALLQSRRAHPEALEAAAVLAAVVAARNKCHDLKARLRKVEEDLCEALDVDSPQDIWTRSNAAPMPRQAPEELLSRRVKHDAEALGRVLGQWHKACFEYHFAVNATPVRGGIGALTLSDFDKATQRLTQGMNKPRGSRDWKRITKENLADQVWRKPRTDLAQDLGVSDVAISKRCSDWGVACPPRGYWQKLNSGLDPRPLLDRNDVTAPQWVNQDLAARFDLIKAA